VALRTITAKLEKFMKRVVVVLLAVAIDLFLGDPPNRFHPIVLMGRWFSGGRDFSKDKSFTTRKLFLWGTCWTLLGAALFALPGWLIEQITKRRAQNAPQPTSFTLLRLLLPSLLLKLVLAYRNLRRAVLAVQKALAENNLPEARRLLSWHLVSRDTGDLNAAEVAGAAIESLAENLTDGLVAPLLAYAAGGLPAAWAYRLVNTADSLWGYRTPEFEQLGKFPARLDDALNWLPARLTGWLLVFSAGLVGENGRVAAQIMRAQHGRTASPNAGWTMSAMAGALGVTLSKRGVYELAGGQGALNVTTLRRAVRVADGAVGLSVTLVCVGVAAATLWSKSKPII
jgi:adenosylcobinamide-phosphate synthase